MLLVLVRLVVQILAADRTEAGAVGAAQDLVRQGKRDRVARPGREIEVVIVQVRRPQLVGAVGIRRLVLARSDRDVEDGIVEAAVAGPVQAGREAQLEDGAGARPGDRELSRDPVGHRQVPLAAKLERLLLELDLVAILLPRAELDLSQIEAPHRFQGSAALPAFAP